MLLAAAGLLILGTAGAVVYAVVPRGVEVAVPDYTGSGCDAASRVWPQRVAGHDRVDTSPASARTRAWGDPAVVARCGLPALGPTTAECLEVDGVDWVVERLSDGARFTTFGRDPAIEVLVPNAYAPEPLLLPAFVPAARALPPNGRHCT
ncbi:DUF3515 family protein [Phycicoccus ginsengisoli]